MTLDPVTGRPVIEPDDPMLQGRTGVFMTVRQRQAVYDMLCFCTDDDRVQEWTRVGGEGGQDHLAASLEVLEELKRLGFNDRLDRLGRMYL